MVPEDFNMKQKVAEVLETSGFAERRSRTMDIDDFLKLLAAFNKENIRFA
jgi:18S rRNA (adenine1779-N6/adenine1780-N6)-dimethyltransferase